MFPNFTFEKPTLTPNNALHMHVRPQSRFLHPQRPLRTLATN